MSIKSNARPGIAHCIEYFLEHADGRPKAAKAPARHAVR